MLLLLIAQLMTAQTVQYQELVFAPSESDNGDLDSSTLTCIENSLVALFPDENGADFIAMTYARDDLARSRACVTWTVERSEAVAQFAGRTRATIPNTFWAATDGSVVYWHEQLQPICLAVGNLTSLRNCFASARFNVTARGNITQINVARPDSASIARLSEIYERKNSNAVAYGLAIAQGKAKHHTSELAP